MTDTTLPLLTATSALATSTEMIVRRSGQTADQRATLNALVSFMNSNLTFADDAGEVSFDDTGTTHTSGALTVQAAIEDLDAALVTTLGGLSDVTIASVADDDILAWDTTAGEWINQSAAEAGLAAASHTHAASDVTSGTFADARIGQSSVTQHEAALTVTESQISDLGSYVPSDPSGVTGADAITNVMSLTQAEYNAITPDASTLYVIT